jgi:hypothetical protein
LNRKIFIASTTQNTYFLTFKNVSLSEKEKKKKSPHNEKTKGKKKFEASKEEKKKVSNIFHLRHNN